MCHRGILGLAATLESHTVSGAELFHDKNNKWQPSGGDGVPGRRGLSSPRRSRNAVYCDERRISGSQPNVLPTMEKQRSSR